MLIAELDTPYGLAEGAVERFLRHDGFVHLRDVLSETLERRGEEITAKVVELNTMLLPLEERSTYEKAFLQVTTIWMQSEVARWHVDQYYWPLGGELTVTAWIPLQDAGRDGTAVLCVGEPELRRAARPVDQRRPSA